MELGVYPKRGRRAEGADRLRFVNYDALKLPLHLRSLSTIRLKLLKEVYGQDEARQVCDELGFHRESC